MTTLVDLRHRRIEADALRLVQPDPADAPSAGTASAIADGAEIILFPKVVRALAQRPRKSLKRRSRLSPEQPTAVSAEETQRIDDLERGSDDAATKVKPAERARARSR